MPSNDCSYNLVRLAPSGGQPQNEKDVADSVHAADQAIYRNHDEVQRWRRAGWGSKECIRLSATATRSLSKSLSIGIRPT
jgi:hypothetical protein